jgi:chromosome segregation protein
MRLKKLYLHGFKTFADKTEISFDQGVTAVVGPNGSGKSNIADAILWVLGEQKASALRGTRASDVIFAGSDKRKAMGMAEVSLTVDNSEGGLPLDFAEVTITRRVYRTGDAEYFINKSACRLKDIYELFLDTGVGRESYSLVNQSEIDAVLSVNPEDRRGLFEEAAGIKKYRVKKREALRKLEATEQNLTRVHDILSEIIGRIEPLRIQAEIAEHYNMLRERLRAIESTLLVIDLRTTSAELNVVRKARTQEEEKVAQHVVGLESAENKVEEIAHRLSDADASLETARLQYQAAMTQAERAQSELALAAQRAETLQDQLRRIAGERDELALSTAELASRIERLTADLAEAQTAEATHTSQVRAHQEALNALTREVGERTRQIERRHADSLALARKHAGQQAEFSRAEARVLELESSLPGLIAERDRAEAQLALELETQRQTEQERNAARERLTAANRLVETASAQRDSCRQGASGLQKAVTDAESRGMQITSRLKALEDLEASREGYYGGVRAVFEALKRKTLSGDYTLVADAFVSPPGFETALETALGASLQDIITNKEAEARAAIDFLYESRNGRATFLPLERMRPPRDRMDLGRSEGAPGVHGCALDLVTFEERFRPALDSLMGRVIICDSMDEGTRVARDARGWSRIVTLRGEVILPSGAMSGGRQTGKQSGEILGRKNEILSLKDQAKKAQQSVEAAQKAAQAGAAERERTDAALAEAQGAKQAAQFTESDAARRFEFCASNIRRAKEAVDHTVRRYAAAEETLERARHQASSAAAALESGGAETAGHDEAAAEEQEQLRLLTSQRDNLAAELTTARVALATESEKVANLGRSLRSAKFESEQSAQRDAEKARQQQMAHQESEDLVSRAAIREAESVRAAKHKEETHVSLEEHQKARQVLLQESYTANASLRALGEARAAALESIHKLELKEARFDVQLTQIAARLQEEYEISADEALSAPEDPAMADGSPQEVNRLRRELKQMGEVNTGSIAEYAEVVERSTYLTAQKDDLEESRVKLLEAIGEIDQSTRGVFMETFKAVAEAFDRLFVRLFRGGKTELVLTDPNDILETGIEIIVQPPGKKKQNLALLSGGERALTAAALLFAFLEVKPSPFVVMDEVDAPLDGANVERFADLLRDFGIRSQFIIITHNPTTMEAAPMWYGVTMQEPGISRVLGMQVPSGLEDPHQDQPKKKTAKPEPELAAAG